MVKRSVLTLCVLVLALATGACKKSEDTKTEPAPAAGDGAQSRGEPAAAGESAEPAAEKSAEPDLSFDPAKLIDIQVAVSAGLGKTEITHEMKDGMVYYRIKPAGPAFTLIVQEVADKEAAPAAYVDMKKVASDLKRDKGIGGDVPGVGDQAYGIATKDERDGGTTILYDLTAQRDRFVVEVRGSTHKAEGTRQPPSREISNLKSRSAALANLVLNRLK